MTGEAPAEPTTPPQLARYETGVENMAETRRGSCSLVPGQPLTKTSPDTTSYFHTVQTVSGTHSPAAHGWWGL